MNKKKVPKKTAEKKEIKKEQKTKKQSGLKKEVETPKRRFNDREFRLPSDTELITKQYFDISCFSHQVIERFIRFRSTEGRSVSTFVCGIVRDFFENPPQNDWGKSEARDFRETFIQILEEKFGMKIRICRNCATDDWADCRRRVAFQDMCVSVDNWRPRIFKEAKE